jgi:hypothetical protein
MVYRTLPSAVPQPPPVPQPSLAFTLPLGVSYGAYLIITFVAIQSLVQYYLCVHVLTLLFMFSIVVIALD